ncbi:MAG: Crp/Fnr family transcriptional regulator [candidate division Zixibacteria bacterium]|nr:Crp/Fnr family transcriptional regulator [candidate division Zixibacteria bacterium]
MDAQNLLRRCYLCKDLNRRELADLARIASIYRVNRGKIIFFEGDPASGFYVLLSGCIRIYKASADGKEYTLHRIHPGQMFAEAAMFGGETFPANSTATKDSVIAFFPKDRFTELIASSPEMSLKMIAALSGFVRDFNRQIEDLSLKEVSARLASYLLRKAEQSGCPQVTLETTKAELARSLGTISETLSRNLKKMRELNMIHVKGKNITILDPARLQAIANGERI